MEAQVGDLAVGFCGGDSGYGVADALRACWIYRANRDQHYRNCMEPGLLFRGAGAGFRGFDTGCGDLPFLRAVPRNVGRKGCGRIQSGHGVFRFDAARICAVVRRDTVGGRKRHGDWRSGGGFVLPAAVGDEFSGTGDFQRGALPLCVRSGRPAGLFKRPDRVGLESERLRTFKPSEMTVCDYKWSPRKPLESPAAARKLWSTAEGSFCSSRRTIARAAEWPATSLVADLLAASWAEPRKATVSHSRGAVRS